jgi:hypothetical protein
MLEAEAAIPVQSWKSARGLEAPGGASIPLFILDSEKFDGLPYGVVMAFPSLRSTS